MAVTTCLTFELVVLKRGKSTLQEGMPFLWLIDWMTPPSFVPSLPGPPGSLAGWFATDDGLSNLSHQARGMPGCQFCSVFALVYRSHSPAHGGHICSPLKDCLIAELGSPEGAFAGTTLPNWGLRICKRKVWQGSSWGCPFPFFVGDMKWEDLLAQETGYYASLSSAHRGISPFSSPLTGTAQYNPPLIRRPNGNSSKNVSSLASQTLPMFKLPKRRSY